jgi:CRP/FNR family transcriptional regulator, dissimilatory nitrate respiration regulator
MIEVDLLARFPALEALNAAARREIAARGVIRDFAPEAVLWRAGDEPRGIFLVLSGAVDVVRFAAGRQHRVHSETSGGTLGEIPFFQGGRYPATAIAARATQCLVLDRMALEAAIRADPELAFFLLGGLAGRVRILIDRLDALLGKTVEQRLAGVLLIRATSGQDGTFTLGASQSRVAEELGTTREVLARALGRLVRRGLLARRARGCFALLDPAEVERLSRGSA